VSDESALAGPVGAAGPTDPGPALADFIGYALARGLIARSDVNWAVNRVLEVLGLDAPGSWDGVPEPPGLEDADAAVAGLLSVGVAAGRVADTQGQRDLLDAALFNWVAATLGAPMVRSPKNIIRSGT